MDALELIPAALFAGLGLRSAIHWGRRPFDSTDPVDHLLYAVFVTGRVGTWFAFAGLFAIFGLTTTKGQAFVDDVNRFRWFIFLFVLLGIAQVGAGWFLGHRAPRAPRH